MERTAEEFVHQLPDGRWFVADYPTGDVYPIVALKPRGGNYLPNHTEEEITNEYEFNEDGSRAR